MDFFEANPEVIEYFRSKELGTLFDSAPLFEPKVGNFETASETKSALASFCCWKKALIFLIDGLLSKGFVSDGPSEFPSPLPFLLEEPDFLLFGDDFFVVTGVWMFS